MGELMLYVKWICLLPLSFVMAVVGRVLGQKTKPGDWLDMDGQEGVSDQPYGKSGYWLKRVYRGEKLACWHLYVIRQWSLLPSKCLRISMGWKLFSFDGLKEETHQLTCYCNPLKTFKQ